VIYTKDIDEAIHYIKTAEKDKVDVSSQPDRAVFYSGGQTVRYKGENHGENRKKAEDFCAKHPKYTTLEKTPFGQYLEKNDAELRKTFGDEGIKKIWAATSERYAKEALGEIKAFVAEAKHDKIFRKNELKTLINNDKVTHINGVSRQELQKDLRKFPDLQANLFEAFHKVKDSNVGKDLRISWDGNKESPKNETRNFEIQRSSGDKVIAEVKGLEKDEKFSIDKLSKATKKQFESAKPNKRISIDMQQEHIQRQIEQVQIQQQIAEQQKQMMQNR
jgi:uncharacterized protein YkuJ